ncbi:MAG: ribosomal protein S18-alanine N-acetyltransferase [Deltaproteobacteria bacterium]|nr:ribosomal protein S18-alanine N-acetyltransferase [Deltaproteobacteria bacterium]
MISLLRITAENYEDHLERIVEIETLSFSSPWSRAGFIREVKNPLSTIWAASIDGSLLGFICYWVLDFEIHLLDLAVHPKERRKGVGRFLLGHMIKEAVSKALESIWLEVRVSNEGAVKLYQELGFEQAGIRFKYYDDTGEDALVMRLGFSGSLPVLNCSNVGGRF